MNRKYIKRQILKLALLALLISNHGYKLYGSTNATKTEISPPKSAQHIEKYIYKQTPQGELAIYVHFPEDWTTNDKQPAIVFFFGGGWIGGNIKELVPHAEYLAKRGMVTARAEYRIKSRHGTMPDKCVEDGKSALRWLRTNAAKLGIDPDRIVASGVSAGGHVAASTYTTKGLEAKREDLSVSSKPNLLVLFEPVLQCAGLVREVGSKEMAVRISPYDNLTKDITPLVVLCGMEDWLVVEAVEFIEKCKKLGIIAELYTAEGQEHGALLKSPWLERAIYLMDKFLARYGYTQGEPTIKLSEGKIEMKKILPTSLNVKDTWAYTPLHRAARNGQKELVKVFIANGADVNAKDNWFTPLFYTFRCGDKELVEFLIDNGADVNAKGRWGRTPLYYAAGRGDKELIELFITKGADVNVKDPTSNTPLHNAVKSRAAGKDIIELLITKGATLNAKNNDDQTPIDVAFQQNRKDIVELLFVKGADVSLHTAARYGLLEKLKELIGKGTDINAVDSSGMTSLHHAVRRGHKEIVALLLVNGADINAKNNEGQTPVDIAAGQNRIGLAKLLISRGADVSIHIAARLGDLAILKSLVEERADINAKDTSGRTALHYAVEEGHKDVVESLLANGADVNVKDKDGNAPGHVALGEDKRPILELLIANGANLDSIHLSAYQGDLVKVKSFVEKGTDVNATDSYGATPLHYAARRSHKEVVEFLVARGADVNAKDKRNLTPLHRAATGGNKDIVKLLINNAANINAKARWDYTPIYYAAWSGITEVVELLIEKGADVNAKDEWGWTPLHYMAQHDYYRDMAEFLIVKGADVNAKDKWGETPLQVAKDKEHTEIVELLRKHDAEAELWVLPLKIDSIPPSDVMKHYLLRQAQEKFEKWKREYEQRKTIQQIAEYQGRLRDKFIEVIGGLPERTPLNARVTKVVQRKGYKVEMVIFESQPKHFVTSALFLPDSEHFQPPYPGVLALVGHSLTAKLRDVYQTMGALLALNGIASLVFDPIDQGERGQLLSDWPTISGGIGHTMIGVGSILLGRNTAQFEIWDGMRAIDYLQSRSDIDPNRIGCSGVSGGGTQTAYLVALDDRVKAAAPACWITNFERLFATVGPQDAEQNIYDQLGFSMDEADTLMMRAPTPILICAATKDFIDIEGTWTSFRYAKRLYSRLGFSERIDLMEYDGKHSYDKLMREATTYWMKRWLRNEDEPVSEPPIVLLGKQQIQCTPKGQVMLLPGARSAYDLNRDFEKELANRRKKLWANIMRVDLFDYIRRLCGIRKLTELLKPTIENVGVIARPGYNIRKVILKLEQGVYLPALMFVPDQVSDKGAVLYTHEDGKGADAGIGGPIEKLVNGGKVVLAVDLRGTGETQSLGQINANLNPYFGPDWKDFFTAYLLGRSYVGMRTEDVLICARFLQEEYETPVAMIAIGHVSIPALHAAAIEPDIFCSVKLVRPLISWSNVIELGQSRNQLINVVHGALEVYDLPDLARTLGSRLAIEQPLNALGEPIEE